MSNMSTLADKASDAGGNRGSPRDGREVLDEMSKRAAIGRIGEKVRRT